jgi:hypothetical protein
LITEFNHDPDMLENGPYPLFLKRRIKGSEGHLSNVEGVCLLASLVHERLDHVVCAHLSETNNTPDTVYGEVRKSLVNSGFGNVNLMIGEQQTPGPLIELRDRLAGGVEHELGLNEDRTPPY